MATLPVDASFFHAFVGSAVALPESFTRGWEEAWNAIAASDSHPGAFERWQYFKKREGIATLEEHNVRQGFFERGEFVAFRTALPDYLKPAVTFAYFTGWRRGEILGLKWNQIDLAATSVRIEADATKSKKARTIALHGELLKAIQDQWENRKVAEIPGHSPTLLCPYVFHRNGKPLGAFRDAWDKALQETGLTGKILHDFRRTAVRNMTRAGYQSAWQ